MPTVSIGTIDKRINSTKQTFSSSFSADCKLKEPCSMQAPVFKVQGLSKSSLYNYCQFEGRYYWVDDIVYLTNDIQEVHCHLDPLATYKDAIKATKAFCQLADKAHWNKFMDDMRINPEREDAASSTIMEKDMSGTFSQTGTIIVRTFCTSWSFTYHFGGVVTWAVSPSDFRQMLSSYYSEISGKTIEEIAGKLGGMGSLRDNIISCIWVPFNVTSSVTNNLIIGAIDSGISAYVVPDNLIGNISGAFTLDWSYTFDRPYKKDGRWTSLQLVTPFGYADIPIDTLVDSATLYIKLVCNKCTGDILFSAWESGYGNGTCYGVWSASCAVDMMSLLGTGQGLMQQLGQGAITGAKLGLSAASLGMSLGSSAMSVSNAAADLSSAQNAFAASGSTADAAKLSSTYNRYSETAAKSRVSAVNSGIDFASSLPSSKSVSAPSGGISGSGLCALYMLDDFAKVKLIRKVFDYADSANYESFCDQYGYPCNKYLTLGDVTGFVKCSGASVNTAEASEAAKSTINSYLNAGIYIE